MDREFFLMMSVTDENLSWYRDLNFRNLHVDVNSPGFVLSNKMFGKLLCAVFTEIQPESRVVERE